MSFAGAENFIDGVAVVAEVSRVVSESVYASNGSEIPSEGCEQVAGHHGNGPDGVLGS